MRRSNTSLLDAHDAARRYPFDLWSRPAEGRLRQRVQKLGAHFIQGEKAVEMNGTNAVFTDSVMCSIFNYINL